MTATTIKFEFPLFDIEGCRHNTICKERTLTLTPEFLHYKVIANYDELNEETGLWEDTKCNYRWIRKRDDISEISMHYSNDVDLYDVNIDFNGVVSPSPFSFEKPKEALEFYNTLQKYWIEGFDSLLQV